ncbi:MAG: InlB B-repeat-containing protein, partial [Clostridia bacterium]|nr:InlB B-repeat-containing protein [Clostridia bacterium]MBR3152175.1 InlB B-repeat-containing protein [Clostridia bacterium]MBR3152288.1 InlB B-repeat-containing protein [Clostridia bacterium]
MEPREHKREKRNLIIVLLIALLMLAITFVAFKAYSKYALNLDVDQEITLKNAVINEAEITLSPDSWTNGNVTVTITTTKTGGNIFYKIGEDGTWTEYENPFEVSDNCVIYARLQYLDGNGPITSKEINKIERTAPQASITSTNNMASSQTVVLSMDDNVGLAAYYWGTKNPQTETVNWTNNTATSVNKTVSAEGKYYLGVKDQAGNITVVSKEFYKTQFVANSNYGSSIAYIISMEGKTITLATTPAITGYTFSGWYTAATGGTKVGNAGASYTPTSTSTLQGQWTANNYTVTFDANDGTVSPASKSVTYDSVYGELPTPTRTGYTFDGWSLKKIENLPDEYQQVEYIESDGTQYIDSEYKPGPNTGIESTYEFKNTNVQQRLFGVSSNDVISGTLSCDYYISGGTIWAWAYHNGAGDWQWTGVNADTNKHTIYYNINNKLTLDSESVFSRSLTKANNISSENMPILARKAIDKNNVIMNYASLKLYSFNIYESGEIVRNYVPCYNKTTGEVGLYEVIQGKFYSKESGNDFTYGDSNLYVTSATINKTPANHTLYANWTANNYTVTFDPNGGSVSPTSKSVTYDDTYGTLPTPTKAGYTFQGWSLQGISGYITSSTTVTQAQNHTLTANWVDDTKPSKPIMVGHYSSDNSSYTSNTWTNSEVYTTVTTTEAGSGIKEMQYSLNNGSTWKKASFSHSNGIHQNGTTWTAEEHWNVTNGRDITIYFRAVDNDGNISDVSDPFTVKYDTAAPSLAITSTPSDNPSSASSITYNFTFSENVTGFTADDIEVTNGSKGTFSGSGKEYTLIVTNSILEGSQVVSVAANKCVDRAQNGNTAASKTALIDKVAPTVTFGTNGNSTYQKSQSTTVTVADTISGVDSSSLKYQWTQSTTAPAENTFSENFTNGDNITKDSVTGNNWYLWILAKDQLGNTTITKSEAFYLDNTGPEILDIYAKSNGVDYDGSSWTNKHVYVYVNARDISGISGFRWGTGSNPSSDWSFNNYVISETESQGIMHFTQNRNQNIKFKAIDNADNSSEIVNWNIKIDITAPTITVSPESVSSTKSQSVTITAADALSGLASNNSYQYALSTSNETAPSSGWTNYTSGSATTIGTDLNGTYYLWVKQVADNATNVSTTGGTKVGNYHVYGPYVFDNTAPEVIITGEANGVTDGLIRYFDGNNNLGNGHSDTTTTWKDLSGNQDGIVNGATFSSDGYANFDGVDDWINLGQTRDLSQVTVQAEVNFNSIQSNGRVILGNIESGGYALYIDNGNPVFEVFVSGAYRRAQYDEPLVANRHYTLAGTYDGNTVRLYVDGVLYAETEYAGTIANPQNNTVAAIGTNPNGSNRAMDDANMKLYTARIYNRALSQAEIKQNMNADRIKPVRIGATQNSVNLSIVFNEDVAGLTADDFTGTNCTIGELTGSGNRYTLGVTGIPVSKTMTVSLEENSYTDIAGNNGPAKSISRYRDSSGPNSTITSLAGDLTNSDTVTYKITYQDAWVYGFDTDDITVTNGTIVSLTRTGEKEHQLVVSNNGSGEQTISIRAGAFRDAMGNGSSAASKTITIDRDAPTVEFTKNGDNTWKKSNGTVVTVSDSSAGVDTDSLKYLWSQSTTAPVESDFSSSFDSGDTITKTDATRGEWYLWILAKDTLGNTTITKSNAFNLDSTTYNISYSLNGGSVSGNPTTYDVESSNITLNNPTKAGYDFKGWSGTGLTGDTNQSVTIATASYGNRSYTANWTPRNDTSYTVKYYVHDLGANTYTLDSTDSTRVGTTDTNVQVSMLVKSIAGFTYEDAYITGNTTKPSSGAITEASILGDGSRVINLYYRRNRLYVQYDVNGGTRAASTNSNNAGYGVSGSLITNSNNTYGSSTTQFLRGLYGGKVGDVNLSTSASTGIYGLHNWDNPDAIRVIKAGYTAKTNAQWNTNASGTGTSYNHSNENYSANNFAGCDLSQGDQVVTLYVNWVDTTAPTKPTIEGFYNDNNTSYTSNTWTNREIYTRITSTDAG